MLQAIIFSIMTLVAIAPEHFDMDTSDVMNSGLKPQIESIALFRYTFNVSSNTFCGMPVWTNAKKRGKKLPDACIT